MPSASSSSSPASAVCLLLAGVPRLELRGGKVIALPALDALLLAWLALHGETARERLAALLWPDNEPAAARNALRQRLFRLRRLAGVELAAGGATLRLADGVTHDLDDTGTLLEGLSAGAAGAAGVPGSELERWLGDERTRRRSRARGALEAHIATLEAGGDADAALPLALALVDQEPLSEDAHRRVMRLHYLRGDRAAALLAFDRCEQVLKHEVGARPSSQTLALLRLLSAAEERAPRMPGSGMADAPPSGETAAAPPPRPRQLPVTLLRPPRLVGRDAELAALRRGWVAGTPILVQGEAGIGKSRLLHTLASDDASLVTAAGRPGDMLVPYATLVRLLQRLVQRVGAALEGRTRRALAPLLPMLEAEGGAAGAGAAVSRRASLAAPVLSLLQQAASQIGGIVLDDLHFADTASLELLRALLTRPRGETVALRWCLGHRPAAPGSTLADLIEALSAAGPVTTIVLRPLDDAALAELVASLHLPGIGGPEANAWAPLLRQRSGGNPLFALETLKAAWNEGSLGEGALAAASGAGEPGSAAPVAATLPRPRSLDQLIALQLSRLSATALALARLAAVAGVDFALPLAEALLGQPALALADPWHELEAQQVFADNGHFAHDLILDTVLGGVPAPIARRLHGQVAQWLEGSGAAVSAADPARIAAHWERAGQPERALPHLRAAADRAHLALREHERIDFLLRAADIAESHGERDAAFASVSAALRSHINTIRDAGGLRLLDRLDRLATTRVQQAEAAGLRAWYAVQLADLPGGIAQGRRALALAEGLDDPLPALVIRQRLATALAAAGDFGAAQAEFETATRTLAAPGVQLADADLAEFHGNHAAVLDNLGRRDAAATQRRLAIAAAVRAGDAAQQVSQLANQAVSLHAAGQWSEMRDALARAERLIAGYEMSGSTVGFVAVLRCQAERTVGRFAAALAAADEAQRLLEASNPARLPVVQLQRGHVWLDLGQTTRALQALHSAATGLPPHLEARRCLLLSRAMSGAAGRAWLARAEAASPSVGWPELSLLVAIERSRTLGLADALPALLALERRAIAQALGGVQRAVRLRLLERLLDGADAACSPTARAPASEAATATAFDLLAEPLAADRSVAALAYVLELPWLASRWLAVRGYAAEAALLQRQLHAWVQACAMHDVPAAFRAGFEQHQAVNRAVLGAGAGS